jgi:hypothetical protein
MIPCNLRALLLSVCVACVVLAPSGALAATAKAPVKHPTPAERLLLDSHELWATIDVCNPANSPDAVGIRGSMPGDGHAHDQMFMSFRLQYLEAQTNTWLDVDSGATPAFLPVGAGASSRQGGSSFQLVPKLGSAAVTLRGVVDFQWRRGKKLVLAGTSATTAGHKALAGADPAGYNAATCLIA